MQNDNYIPEASEPDFYVEGRLVDPSWAHAVRTGWKAGLVWLALKAVLFAIGRGLGNPPGRWAGTLRYRLRSTGCAHLWSLQMEAVASGHSVSLLDRQHLCCGLGA